MVVSCSIMQCSRTIFVLCTDFSRVFPQQLQFLLNKVQPSISGCLLNNKIVIFRNNCFSLTESPRSKCQTSLSVYRQFTSLLYFNFYLYTAHAAHYFYFTNLGKFTTDGLDHQPSQHLYNLSNISDYSVLLLLDVKIKCFKNKDILYSIFQEIFN